MHQNWLPRLKEEIREKAARSYKAATVVVSDRLCARWPLHACTTMFFLIPKNIASQRRISLQHTLIRWCEWLGVLEVSECQERHRGGWDTIDG